MTIFSIQYYPGQDAPAHAAAPATATTLTATTTASSGPGIGLWVLIGAMVAFAVYVIAKPGRTMVNGWFVDTAPFRQAEPGVRMGHIQEIGGLS